MKRLIVLLVVLVVGAGLWWVLMGKKAGDGELDKSLIEKIPGGKEISTKDEGFQGLLMEAVEMGIPLKCTYTQDGKEMTGYLKDKKYYGEVYQNGQEAKIIMSGMCMWTWNVEQARGAKLCFESDKENGTLWDGMAEAGKEMGGADSQMRVEAKCFPAVIDDSVFVPPSDVEFITI